jgi:hypothetical protein
MLQHAFKEWAVICKALAQGRQAIILRKGGIAEEGGSFRVEHTRFWLWPTYVHQQRDGIRPDAQPILEQIESERPPEGVVRLSHFAEVAGMYHVHQLAPALLLAQLHFWSEQTVRNRFAYRQPGLFVLPVRLYRAKQVFEVADDPAYAGCKSWVELKEPLPDEGEPVLDEASFRDVLLSLDRILNPTAFA